MRGLSEEQNEFYAVWEAAGYPKFSVDKESGEFVGFSRGLVLEFVNSLQGLDIGAGQGKPVKISFEDQSGKEMHFTAFD